MWHIQYDGARSFTKQIHDTGCFITIPYAINIHAKLHGRIPSGSVASFLTVSYRPVPESAATANNSFPSKINDAIAVQLTKQFSCIHLHPVKTRGKMLNLRTGACAKPRLGLEPPAWRREDVSLRFEPPPSYPAPSNSVTRYVWLNQLAQEQRAEVKNGTADKQASIS